MHSGWTGPERPDAPRSDEDDQKRRWSASWRHKTRAARAQLEDTIESAQTQAAEMRRDTAFITHGTSILGDLPCQLCHWPGLAQNGDLNENPPAWRGACRTGCPGLPPWEVHTDDHLRGSLLGQHVGPVALAELPYSRQRMRPRLRRFPDRTVPAHTPA